MALEVVGVGEERRVRVVRRMVEGESLILIFVVMSRLFRYC
jgi:hypothetical protein